MRRFSITVAVLCTAALLTGGCANSGGSSSPSSSGGEVRGAITVLAASSLKESFAVIGKQFETAHPGTTVTFSFAASSALADQIAAGSPADVFASASSKNMDAVVSAGAAGNPVTFATNALEIATPPSNPARIATVADLASPSVKVAVCQPDAPCGKLATTVFDNAKVTVTPVSLEPDVKAVLSKVKLGEVDAGLVYVTDVKSAGSTVTGIEIPADVNATTKYPIASLNSSANAATAKAFVDYVLSPEGQAVLTSGGFGSP